MSDTLEQKIAILKAEITPLIDMRNDLNERITELKRQIDKLNGR